MCVSKLNKKDSKVLCVTVMRDVSSRLFQSLFDAYDPEWDGAEDLGAIVEVGLMKITCVIKH